MPHLEKKIQLLQSHLLSLKKFAIGYSGGVDSTFLVNFAYESGCDVYAVTFSTELISSSEIGEAYDHIHDNIKHDVIDLSVLAHEIISNNPIDRCYHCKLYLFQKLKERALDSGYRYILEGSNSDDSSDYRPGTQALKELDIISPLRDAGLTKNDIRELSKRKGYQTWNKPANPCLATRIPYDKPVTEEKLQRIDKAEKFIKDAGITVVRVRDHDTIARIEVENESFTKILEMRTALTDYLISLGYSYVTLDLLGYSMGSFNKTIT